MLAFIFSTLYLALNLLSLATFVPELATSGYMNISAGLAVLATLITAPTLWPIWRHPVFFALLGLMSAISISSLANGWLGGAFYSARLFLPIALILPLSGANITSVKRLALMRNVLVMIAVLYAAIGLFDLVVQKEDSKFVLRVPNPDVDEADRPDSPDRIKGIGLLDDPNDFAQYLLVCLTLSFGATRDAQGLLFRACRYLISLALLLGVLATRSRGALVALAMLAAVLAWDRFKWKGAGPVLVLGAAAATSFSKIAGRDLSMSGGEDRLALWSDALGFIKQSPVFGSGLGSAPDLLGLTAHNSYVLCWLELGFLGSLCWNALIVVSMVPIWKLASVNEIGGRDHWAYSIRNALIVLLATSFFLSRTFSPVFMILIGIAYAYPQIRTATGPAFAQPLLPKSWMGLCLAATAASLILPYLLVRLQHMFN